MSYDAFGSSYQRHVFFTAGTSSNTEWVFGCTNVGQFAYITNQTDLGVANPSWTFTNIQGCQSIFTGPFLDASNNGGGLSGTTTDVYYDGTDFAYCAVDPGTQAKIDVNTGSISGQTITWGGSPLQYSTGSGSDTNYFCAITSDSNDIPWVVYTNQAGIFLMKLTNKISPVAAEAVASGYPVQVSTDGNNVVGSVYGLSQGVVCVVYDSSKDQTPLTIRCVNNGGSLQNAVSSNLLPYSSYQFSAVANKYCTTCAIQFQQYLSIFMFTGDKYLEFLQFNYNQYAFVTQIATDTIFSGLTPIGVQTSIDQTSGTVYLAWADNPTDGNIFYQSWNYSTGFVQSKIKTLSVYSTGCSLFCPPIDTQTWSMVDVMPKISSSTVLPFVYSDSSRFGQAGYLIYSTATQSTAPPPTVGETNSQNWNNFFIPFLTVIVITTSLYVLAPPSGGVMGFALAIGAMGYYGVVPQFVYVLTGVFLFMGLALRSGVSRVKGGLWVMAQGVLLVIDLFAGGFTAPTLLFSAIWAAILLATGIGIAAGIQIFGSGISSQSVWFAFWITLLAADWAFFALDAFFSFATQFFFGSILIGIVTVFYIMGASEMVAWG